MRRVAILSSCLALCFLLGACQKLETVRPLEGRGRGDLPKEKLAFLDALPADYGDLIAVTSHADYPIWAQAWFQRADKSIVVVWVNARTGAMLEDVLVIPRR
jgi:hypothetical protein